ncbi:MAG: hypothetical protein HXS50_05570 [Theionarchaea archaeon]|nr:hypothetical protein [Theionarchaea archaeon]
MSVVDNYAALLIIVGQVLAVGGVLLVLVLAIHRRLQDRVESGKRPDRTGLPYPDLYYWHVLRQRSSVSGKIKRGLGMKKGRYEGM